MDFIPINLNTLIPQLPSIYNKNNKILQNYIDVFYDNSTGVIIKPVSTSGKIKGGTGEFVSLIVDNLIVKKQQTNMYQNATTADYDYYTMINDTSISSRSANSGWPYENPSYKYIDVTKPYYKINNGNPIALQTQTVSQIVGILFDSSTASSNNFQIIMDPCIGTIYEVDISDAGLFYTEFICTGYDPSWGSTWTQYKY